MNNSSSSSSSLVLKLKRHTNNLTNMINEDNQQTRSTNSSRLKRTIAANTNNSTGTATRRASSPAFNGKQQTTSKRSVTIDNNNNDLTASNDDNSSTKRFKSDELNVNRLTKNTIKRKEAVTNDLFIFVFSHQTKSMPALKQFRSVLLQNLINSALVNPFVIIFFDLQWFHRIQTLFFSLFLRFISGYERRSRRHRLE